MHVGRCIKDARKSAGLTQEELGKMLGISGAAVAQYETGKRNPKPETLSRFACALNISVSQLLGFSPEDLGGDPNNVDWMNFNRAILEAGISSDLDKIVNSFLETDAVSILQFLEQLNSEGKKKAIERIAELAEIPRYQKEKNAPDAVNTGSGEEDTDH